MTDLYASIVRLIERTVQRPLDGFSSAIFPGPEAEWPRHGRFFSLQKDRSPVIIYPWFGIYDTAVGPVLYIGFGGDSGWCQQVYQPAISANIPEGKTFSRPYNDPVRREICFAIKDHFLSSLFRTVHQPAEDILINDFFAEVVYEIGRYLD